MNRPSLCCKDSWAIKTNNTDACLTCNKAITNSILQGSASTPNLDGYKSNGFRRKK